MYYLSKKDVPIFVYILYSCFVFEKVGVNKFISLG